MADIDPHPPTAGGTLAARPDLAHIWTALRAWWAVQVESVDQQAVIDKIRADGGWTARYGFMICMAGGIAILGLILSSPAVVIGAMLLSPLMGPILAIGFALAIGDAEWLREAARALGLGALIAVLFCALIVLVSPLQTVTSEIAARTRPNLFDLLVALFSALAGAYAMIRGRGETIVGVAIATALMPPLAVVGFGLATWNWTVFGGAFALFITNLVTIALSAAVMARLYHFRANLSAKQTYYQVIGIFVAFLVLAVPLGFSLWQIAWEARASASINGAIRDQFGRNARLSQLEIDYGTDLIGVTATVLTPTIQPQAEALAKRTLERQLDRKLNISIRQFQVGTGSKDAEEAQLAAARNDERQRLVQARDTLANQLAMVAGVPAGQVLVDAAQRRATVRAAILPDAGLGAYRALEARVAATMPSWQIAMIPPAAPLPALPESLTRLELPAVPEPRSRREKAPPPSAEDMAAAVKKVTDALAKSPALDLAAWAAKRLDAPIGVSGPDDAVGFVVAALRAKGVRAEAADTGAASGPVRLSWLAPDATKQP
jgi:uncharacterized hydrophobic protein (TIGR00271 family)